MPGADEGVHRTPVNSTKLDRRRARRRVVPFGGEHDAPASRCKTIGAKSVEQLDDNLAATTLTLSADELAKLDSVSALPSEYPGWMFEQQGASRVSKPFTGKK